MFSIILSLVKVIQKIMHAYLFLLQELMMNIFKLFKFCSSCENKSCNYIAFQLLLFPNICAVHKQDLCA